MLGPSQTNDEVKIFIRTFSGTFELPVKLTDTVISLYSNINQKLDVAPENSKFERSDVESYNHWRLSFKGQFLSSDFGSRTLQEVGIKSQSLIDCISRCNTGRPVNIIYYNADNIEIKMVVNKERSDNTKNFKKKLSEILGCECLCLRVKVREKERLDVGYTYKILADNDYPPDVDLYAEFGGTIISINQTNSEINEKRYYQDNKGDNLLPLVKINEANNQKEILPIHSNSDVQSSPSGQRSYLQPFYGLSATVGGIVGGVCGKIASSNNLDIILQRSPVKNPNLTTVAFMVGGAIIGVTIKFGIDLIRHYYATKQQDSGNQSKKY